MLFTPRALDGTRLEMEIMDTYIPRGGASKKFVVTELVTGKRYSCRSASCGIPKCMCDAIVLNEIAE